MRGRTLLALLSLSACTPDTGVPTLEAMQKNNDELLPMLTDVRLGLADVDPSEEPVVPADEEVVSVVAPDSENYALPGEDDGDRDTERSTDLRSMADLDDPAMLDKHAEADGYTYKARPYGSLFDDNAEADLEFTDVEQGSIGDCYMMAAFGAVLYADADHSLRDGLVREVRDADGRPVAYSVRVYHAWNGPQDIWVDADIPRKGNDKVLYARSADTEYNDEEWAISIMEKAFAQWRGGYEAIGNGGYPGDVMQALTGATATSRWLDSMSDQTLVDTIASAVDANRPVTAATYSGGRGPWADLEDGGADPEGTKIYANHAYTVLDAAMGSDGAYVKLRNPWGSVEAPETFGEDDTFDTELEVDDGIMWITARQFRRLYSSLSLGGAFEPDEVPPADLAGIDVELGENGQATLHFVATGDDEHEGLAFAYDLRISDAPIDDNTFADADAVPVADPQFPGTEEAIVLEDLQTDRVTYVGLRILDEIGQASWTATAEIDFGGADTGPDGEETVYSFEDNQDGWERESAESFWDRSDLEAADGEYSFRFGESGQDAFADGKVATGHVTSPRIDLRDAQSASLSWQQLLDVEEGAEYDIAAVDVYVDGEPTQVWVKSNDALPGAWTTQSVDLSAFLGQVIEIRYTFDSIDDVNNDGLGWFIDEVRVVVD